MRHPILLVTSAVAAVVALAPERAFAGDAEADKRIYDAFERYISTVPVDRRAQEYQKFLDWYPNNIYAPTVKKEYEEFLRTQGTSPAPTPTPTKDPKENTTNNYGISTNPPQAVGDSSLPDADPMEEAAGAVGGYEDDAADALGGSNNVAVTEEVPNGVPPSRDNGFTSSALRVPGSFGIGVDFAGSALIGFGLLVDYTSRTSKWTAGAALRFPVFQTTQVAFEARRFLKPEMPVSGYLGFTMGGVYGPMEPIFRLVDRDFPGTSAQSATTVGALTGLQKITPQGKAYYLELSYQLVIPEEGGMAGVPGVSLGYRYFFR